MSQVEETPIMLQARYRVKTLMEEVLTRFDKNEAFMSKSILWKDLQKLLHEVQSYIGDCARQNHIKLMEEIEEKVHLAADFLEEVPFRAVDGAKNERGRKLSRPLPSSSETPETKSLSKKLEEINSLLKKLIDQSEEHLLKKGVIPGSDLSFEPQFELKKPGCSTQEKVEMIGRSEELKQLINVLLQPAKNEEAPLQIIPILGQEGIGKTTLAWAAYDHKQIKDHFDLRVWVSASVSIEAKWVSGKILEALAPNWRAELDSVDEILAVLLEELGGKSFFLVLDDVTGTEATLPMLKLLKDCLLRLNTTRRNKIVITTSSNEVAKEMDMHSQFHLQKLSDDHCKAIFQKEVVSEGGIQVKDIEKLVTLAGGIPLAAKVLGSINDSKAVVESGINDLLQDDLITIQEDDRPTFGALNRSYLHLPPDAQLCFAYMSMFPPNTPIEKVNVIQLWIAHGFFPSRQSSEMEDMGEACFNSLLNSCLIEPAERDSYGYISSVKLARIAWELLASLKLAVSTENHVSDYSGLQLVQASQTTAKLHTFFSVGNNDVSYGRYDFGSLKVLNLSRSQFKKWPDAFENLIHLRYLDVSGTKVAEIPESISKLIYIQTIRAINCSYLERLPKDLSNLEELRHFCIDADNEAIRKGNMPLGLGTLTCLQTLPLLVVSKDPHISVEVLGPLKNLREKLTVCNLENLNPKEAEGWKLMEKARIDELQFEWSMSNEQRDNDTKVLEKLQPNANLKSLTLQNFAGNEITMWKSQAGADTALILKNLMMLKLSNCSKCKKLPTLGTLPCLTELHIEGMDNLEDIGPEFYTTGTAGADESKSKLFPALRKFTLMYLAKLKSWSKAEGADNQVFPLLEELRVEGCDELVSTPSHFQSLKRLHVESVNSGEPLANICSNIASLTSVHISSVLNLQSLPEGILRNNPNLSSLRIWNCPELTQIPKPDTWSCSSSSLRLLSINECEKLENLPENLNNASSLTELIISQCNNLKSIPSVNGLCSLRRLKFEWCSGLESLPSGLQSCTSLEHLTIKGCPSLTSVQDEGLANLTSLCSVNILGCEKLTALPLRELLHYLIKLRRLEIEGFTEDPLGLTIEYPGLTGWARFKALPKPFQTQKIKRAWTIDPKLIETFATKAVGFLEAMQLFETGVKEITR